MATRTSALIPRVVVLVLSALAPSCGGGGGGAPPALPPFGVSSSAFSFGGPQGGGALAGQTLTLTSNTGTPIAWFARTSSSWLTLSVATGVTPSTLTVDADTTGIRGGVYQAKIWIHSNSPVTLTIVTVTLTVTGGAGPVAGAEWTVLVYLNGDNNLESAALDDVNEMEMVGSKAEMNILVMLDRHPNSAAQGRGFTSAEGNWADTRLGGIVQDANPAAITSVFNTVGEENMGDPASLQNFLEAGIAAAPAARYAVIIWNHGQSWKAAGVDDSSADDQLTATEVRAALVAAAGNTGIGSFDLVVFDQCLNASLEIAAEIAPVADYMVGSEDLAPGDGMDYASTLAALAANPTMSAEQLAEQFTRDFIAQYVPANPTVTCSAIDLSMVGAVLTALNNFGNSLSGNMAAEYRNFGRALWNIDSYAQDPNSCSMSDFADLADLAVGVQGLTASGPLSAAAAALVAAVQDAVFYHDNGLGHFFSYGLSIWAPRCSTDYTGFSAAYASTQVAALTSWESTLVSYYGQLAVDATDPVVSGIASTSATTSQTTPATISATVTATDVGDVSLLTGSLVGNTLTVLFKLSLPSVGTVLPNGQVLRAFGASSSVSTPWDSRALAVSNGAMSFWATVDTVGSYFGSFYMVEAVHRTAGLADDKDVMLVFTSGGALQGVFAYADGVPAGSVAPGTGDEFDIYQVQFDLTDPANPVESYVLSGTLTYGVSGLQVLPFQVPNGVYMASICAEDLAENVACDTLFITVNN